MFFLTELDTERLNIRGSRDPLGLIPIWSAFGRKVVTNLTTASDSLRGFTTTLLGLYFAQKAADREADSSAARLAAFLSFEQLAGFTRYIKHQDSNIRGISAIKRRHAASNADRFRIGAESHLQILANQKPYGLWGLYLTPATDSGLVHPKDLTLTPPAVKLVENVYLPLLKGAGLGNGEPIVALIKRKSADVRPHGRESALFNALANLLKPQISSAERRTYHEYLVQGGSKGNETGWQPRVAQLMETRLKGGPFDRQSLNALIASTRKGDELIKAHLARIRDLESLLTSLTFLFSYLQNRDRAKVSRVLKEVRSEWGAGLNHLRPEALAEMSGDIATIYGDKQAAERFTGLGRALYSGRYDEAITGLLEHNAFVMHERDGSMPWITAVRGQLDVRFSAEQQRGLLPKKALASAWRSTFYLNSLKMVSDELRAR